jgi:hypothetical protein
VCGTSGTHTTYPLDVMISVCRSFSISPNNCRHRHSPLGQVKREQRGPTDRVDSDIVLRIFISISSSKKLAAPLPPGSASTPNRLSLSLMVRVASCYIDSLRVARDAEDKMWKSLALNNNINMKSVDDTVTAYKNIGPDSVSHSIRIIWMQNKLLQRKINIKLYLSPPRT